MNIDTTDKKGLQLVAHIKIKRAIKLNNLEKKTPTRETLPSIKFKNIESGIFDDEESGAILIPAIKPMIRETSATLIKQIYHFLCIEKCSHTHILKF